MSLKRTSTPTIPFAASAGPISGGGGGQPPAALAAAAPDDLDVSVIPPSEPPSVSGTLSNSGTTPGNLSTSGNLSNSGGVQRMEQGGDFLALKFDLKAWLPDGYSQIFRSYVFGSSGFWTMAPLRYAV